MAEATAITTDIATVVGAELLFAAAEVTGPTLVLAAAIRGHETTIEWTSGAKETTAGVRAGVVGSKRLLRG